MESDIANPLHQNFAAEAQLICELIVGKKVDQALSILEFTPKKAARFVSKR